VSEAPHNLVQAARKNDLSAWDQLLRGYQLPLFAYARGLTGDREAALDIVQESFSRAVAHIEGLRDDARFGSWLFAIAHQRCVRHLRRAGRPFESGRDGEGQPEPQDDGPDPRGALLSAERARDLYGLVDRLPPAQRSALLLHVVGDFPISEIAEVAGVPPGTVKSRLHHAKRALRALVEREAP